MGTFNHLTQEDKDIIGAELGCKEEDLKQLCDAYDALPVGDDEKKVPFDVYLMSRLCGLKDEEIIQYAKDGSLDERVESLLEDGNFDAGKGSGGLKCDPEKIAKLLQRK